MFPRSLETDLPPPSPCALGGGGGAESTVKMSEPEQPPFTGLPGADALSEDQKRERDEELERIADRFVNTLNAACSKKKKKRR